MQIETDDPRASEDRGLMIALGGLGLLGTVLLVTGLVLLSKGDDPKSPTTVGTPVAPPFVPPLQPPAVINYPPPDLPPPDPDHLPRTPSRSYVISAMRSVSGPVQACGGGQHGVAPVRIVFEGVDGRVSQAQVSGGNQTAAARACIEQAVRAARVPPFEVPTFSVNYPFRL